MGKTIYQYDKSCPEVKKTMRKSDLLFLIVGDFSYFEYVVSTFMKKFL